MVNCPNCRKYIKKKEKPAYLKTKLVCQNCYSKKGYTPEKDRKPPAWIINWRKEKGGFI